VVRKSAVGAFLRALTRARGGLAAALRPVSSVHLVSVAVALVTAVAVLASFAKPSGEPAEALDAAPVEAASGLVIAGSAVSGSAALADAHQRVLAQRAASAAGAAAAAERERQAAAAAAAAAVKARQDAAKAEIARLAKRDPRALGALLAAERGWTGRQWKCLNALWNKESRWLVTADNPTSSAYGIPQALPGSKMASAGADWKTNPATQIRWGLGYIKSRYKTPCAAWSHSQAHNWY
jgi:hypothetical protein